MWWRGMQRWGEEGIRKAVLEVAIISLYHTFMKPIPSLSISEFTKSSTAIISCLQSMSFPKLNPWQLKIENHNFFFFKYPNWEMRKGRSFAICKAAIIPTFTSSLPCESFSHFFPFLAKQYHLLSVAPRWQTSPYLGTHTPFPKSYSSYPSLLPWSSFPLCQRLKVLASFRFLFNFII